MPNDQQLRLERGARGCETHAKGIVIAVTPSRSMLRSKKEVGEETFVGDESLSAEERSTAHQRRFSVENNRASKSNSPEL